MFLVAAGTATAALAFGGYVTTGSGVQQKNGQQVTNVGAWSSAPSTNTARRALGGAGYTYESASGLIISGADRVHLEENQK